MKECMLLHTPVLQYQLKTRGIRGHILHGNVFLMYSIFNVVFMPPTLKKLEGHIAFGLSVCVCVGGWVRLLTFER